MNMFVSSQIFPESDGVIVGALRTGLAAAWAAPTCGTDLLAVKVRRMVTVRDDSGPVNGRVQSRRQGVNLWAESRVAAAQMARDAMHIAQSDLPGARVDNVVVIVATHDFTGPYNVPADTPFVVDGVTLWQYYFTFTADVVAAAA